MSVEVLEDGPRRSKSAPLALVVDPLRAGACRDEPPAADGDSATERQRAAIVVHPAAAGRDPPEPGP